MLARRLDVLWGQLDGRIRLNGGEGLRYDMHVVHAMNLAYFAATEWMSKESRLEFDGHATVTAEQFATFEAEKRERRMKLIQRLGEVNENAGSE